MAPETSPSQPPLFGAEHVRRYRETGGKEGHDWMGTSTLILTTKGRASGQLRATPLIYGKDGDRYVVVASKGGAPTHPAWYLNLMKDPKAEVQVWADTVPVLARVASGAERERLWRLMVGQWPAYEDYRVKTTREIPVVVLEPAVGGG
jgi:deazaflavin-dependent oxidoreductase (nitroreductase family)